MAQDAQDDTPEDDDSLDDTPSVMGTITADRPTEPQLTSQFDLLNISDLSVCGKLMCWIADVSTMPRPVVINDEWNAVRVIAAGIRATTSPGVKSPMALFKSIVGKRQWTKLEPEDITRAQTRLATYRDRIRSMQANQTTRAGPPPLASPSLATPSPATPSVVMTPSTAPSLQATSLLISNGYQATATETKFSFTISQHLLPLDPAFNQLHALESGTISLEPLTPASDPKAPERDPRQMVLPIG